VEFLDAGFVGRDRGALDAGADALIASAASTVTLSSVLSRFSMLRSK